MVIVDAIAHAIDPPLLFSIHQQMEELEAILENCGYLADLADLVEEKVHEVDQKGPRGLGQRGTSKSSKKGSHQV